MRELAAGGRSRFCRSEENARSDEETTHSSLETLCSPETRGEVERGCGEEDREEEVSGRERGDSGGPMPLHTPNSTSADVSADASPGERVRKFGNKNCAEENSSSSSSSRSLVLFNSANRPIAPPKQASCVRIPLPPIL